MYIITQYAKVLKRRTRILTKKYRLYAAFSVFLLLQLSNFRVLYTPCPVCNGSGRVQSRENLSLEIKRRLRTLLKRRSSSKNLLITANPWLAEWLVSKDLRAWERELACTLKVEADASLHVESFMILDNSGVDK